MSIDAQIKLWASQGVRTPLLSVHANFGEQVGLRACRRYLFEVGDVMAEIHGRRLAVEALHNVVDSILGETVFDDIPVWMDVTVPAPAATAQDPFSDEPLTAEEIAEVEADMAEFEERMEELGEMVEEELRHHFRNRTLLQRIRDFFA